VRNEGESLNKWGALIAKAVFEWLDRVDGTLNISEGVSALKS